MNSSGLVCWVYLLASVFSVAHASAPHPSTIGNAQAPQGGTFYLNLGGEPPTLNPITSVDAYAREVQNYVISALLNRNSDTYAWEPALASEWAISKDGKQFTFKIRPGVKWHDGQPLTAEDIKFSFDVIFEPKFNAAHLRPYYEGIEKVEIVDPQTVRFHAKNKYFGNFDSAAELSVIPKHLYGDPDKGSQLNLSLVGTGPYILEKYERGKRITLKKNPEFWGKDLPAYKGVYNFDQVVLRFVSETAVSFEMLKKGEIDYEALQPEYYIEKAKGPEWEKDGKLVKVKVENTSPKSTTFIGWNLKNPLFTDRDVRVALLHLCNRKLMIEKFLYGMGLPATGPWYQQSEYASPKAKAVPFDLKKAQALLKKAGWADSDNDGLLDKEVDGKKTTFRFTAMAANQVWMKYLTVYKEDLKQAGIEMEIKYVEWNAFIKLLDEGKFEALVLGWAGGAVDLNPKQVWHSASAVTGGSNFIGYKNPEVDKLIDQGLEELDKKKRIKTFRKVYELIAADAPYAWLYVPQFQFYGHTSRIGKPKDTFKFAVDRSYWWAKDVK